MIKPPVLLAHLAQQSRHVLVMPLPVCRQLAVMLDEAWLGSIDDNSVKFHLSFINSHCDKYMYYGKF